MRKVSETLGATQSHPWRMLQSLCCLQVTTLARGPGPSRVSGHENNQLLNVMSAGAYSAQDLGTICYARGQGWPVGAYASRGHGPPSHKNGEITIALN